MASVTQISNNKIKMISEHIDTWLITSLKNNIFRILFFK